MRRVYASLRGVSLVAISDAQRTAAPQLPWVTTVHNGNRRGGVPVRIREG